MLTARGWGLLAFAALAVVGAGVFGIAELYALAAAASVAVAYAALWAATRRWQLEVARDLRPSRAEAGQSVLVVLTLANGAGAASPALTMRDPFDGGSRVAELLVAPVPARHQVSGSYRLHPTGRGVHAVGPLVLEMSDPLGLARRARVTAPVSTLVVHPRIEPVRPPRIAAGRGGNRGAALPVPGRDNDEFASLREYRPGDDVRRMHWPSTARTDTLMVREDQLERRGQFSLVLDTRRELWSATTFERATSVAASIAVAVLDAGLDARLVTTGGLDSGTGAGATHRVALLDLLAATSPHAARAAGREERAGTAPPPPAQGGTVVVITSEGGSGDDASRLAAGPRTEVVTVVIERVASAAPGPTGQAARHRGRVVRVGPTSTLAQAWDRSA